MDPDIEGRRGRMIIPAYVAMTGKPIPSKLTGAESRTQIIDPDGYEYAVAEIGSASSWASGPMSLKLRDSYGQFANLHLNSRGAVRA